MKTHHYNIKSPADESPRGLFSFPEKVIRGEGVLQQAGLVFPGKRTMLFADSFVMKNFCRGIKGAGGMDVFVFGGESSPSEFHRASQKMSGSGTEVVIAAGGGKTLDLAKFAVSKAPGVKLVAVPTSASTCSAMTAVSVIYDSRGKYMNTVDVNAPDAVIMDYSIFYSLPKVFFAAGAADTMAKYYETACWHKYEKAWKTDDILVLETAKAVLDDMNKALRKWPFITEETARALAEANIFGSAAVSAAGSMSVTSSMAHGIAAAITASPAAGDFLHGEHAAMGLLAQETLLNNTGNLLKISSLMEKLEMPLSFSEMGIKEKELSGITEFYYKIKAKEKFYVPIDDSMMYNILRSLL